MGPGSSVNFNLKSGGDLVIPNGSVTANGILLTSSRASKTDISEIKSTEIMEKLKQMEVAEWRYKNSILKAKLESETTILKKWLSVLEKVVTKLASSGNAFPNSGKTVALAK